MVDSSFFEESSAQSKIKSRIVAKYFWAWAKVIIPTVRSRGSRIAYVDLFAGPGRYNDGTPSTPVIVLQKAIKEPDLREMLVTFFNDRDASNAQSLRDTIAALPGIDKMRFNPKVENEEVGEKIVSAFQMIKLVPTLLFVDPWGYKGLSLTLINSVLKDWGCDCVIFFNYNRINPGLSNESVREHMNDLFGQDRVEIIRNKMEGLLPEEKENLIIEEFLQALKQFGARFVLPFTFKNEQGTRTRHHLIFASKNFKGYEIMKEIMAGESSQRDQGVATFAYAPASKKYPTLFELNRPMDDLEQLLLNDFAAQRLVMREIYLRHSVDKPYTKSNYKKVLAKLEGENRVTADPPATKRPRRKGEVTFADDVVVTFSPGAKE